MGEKWRGEDWQVQKAKMREAKLKGKRVGITRSRNDEEIPTGMSDYRAYPLTGEPATKSKKDKESRSV